MGLKEDKAERNRDTGESVCVSDREKNREGRGREGEREMTYFSSCLGSNKCPCFISRQLHLYNKFPISGCLLFSAYDNYKRNGEK